jgi:regulatory protein
MRRKQRTTRAGQEESPQAAWTSEQLRERVFQRALKLLAAKPRSIAELRERLLQGRGANKAVVETVVAQLREYGYLDDHLFAFGYASSRVRQKTVGRQRLKRDLMLKKVNSEVVDQALDLVFSEASEEELIGRAIDKRIRLRGSPKNRAEAKKLFDHLLRQGFSYELVWQKVRAVANVEEETTLDDPQTESQGSGF